MGIFDKFIGKKKSSKLATPLLDKKYLGLIGLEFGMYLTWVEDTTKKSIMGKELERRIKMFLQKEKKLGHIQDFNNSDVMHINMLAMACDIKTMQQERKKNNLDGRWPQMEEHIGLKKNL